MNGQAELNRLTALLQAKASPLQRAARQAPRSAVEPVTSRVLRATQPNLKAVTDQMRTLVRG